MPGEKVDRLRTGRARDLCDLARKVTRWVADNIGSIRECDPDIPTAIFNRAADNWEPLLTIAEIIGGTVAERTKRAAVSACGAVEEQSQNVELLADIRGILGASEEISSSDLVSALVAIPARPWTECGRNGKPLTQNLLARKLKPFGIRPGLIGENRLAGYAAKTFSDAFSRYIQPSQGLNHSFPNNINNLDENKTSQQKKCARGCEIV